MSLPTTLAFFYSAVVKLEVLIFCGLDVWLCVLIALSCLSHTDTIVQPHYLVLSFQPLSSICHLHFCSLSVWVLFKICQGRKSSKAIVSFGLKRSQLKAIKKPLKGEMRREMIHSIEDAYAKALLIFKIYFFSFHYNC